mmetsp:Transcript_13705/g.22496  ORF Transcript_13705/g.22496 Transcript_13705/m.22496 type:complete len:251 (+) Transcript_13705:346-1098(+)
MSRQVQTVNHLATVPSHILSRCASSASGWPTTSGPAPRPPSPPGSRTTTRGRCPASSTKGRRTRSRAWWRSTWTSSSRTCPWCPRAARTRTGTRTRRRRSSSRPPPGTSRARTPGRGGRTRPTCAPPSGSSRRSWEGAGRGRGRGLRGAPGCTQTPPAAPTTPWPPNSTTSRPAWGPSKTATPACLGTSLGRRSTWPPPLPWTNSRRRATPPRWSCGAGPTRARQPAAPRRRRPPPKRRGGGGGSWGRRG